MRRREADVGGRRRGTRTAGPPARGRRRSRAAAVAWLGGLLAVAACEVEWGGGHLSLEDPAPIPEPAAPREAEAEAEAVPLPDGPLLYVVRPAAEGRARVVPVARIDRGVGPLELPEASPERWRARFDSVFLAPGTELHVHAGGARIGSLVLDDEATAPDAACASVGRGTLLLPPGQPAPTLAFALPADLTVGPPARAASTAPDRRMATTGPVLAERLIPDRGHLSRRAALRAVHLPGDTVPAMAGTWLVNDALQPGAPAGDAISLFFLARYEPVRGYAPVWTELRRYSDARDKEVFAYLDWLRVPEGRIHLLWRVDGGSEGFAAGFEEAEHGEAGGTGDIGWVESGPCRGMALLDAVSGR